jgi:hypothetical protein
MFLLLASLLTHMVLINTGQRRKLMESTKEELQKSKERDEKNFKIVAQLRQDAARRDRELKKLKDEVSSKVVCIAGWLLFSQSTQLLVQRAEAEAAKLREEMMRIKGGPSNVQAQTASSALKLRSRNAPEEQEPKMTKALLRSSVKFKMGLLQNEACVSVNTFCFSIECPGHTGAGVLNGQSRHSGPHGEARCDATAGLFCPCSSVCAASLFQGTEQAADREATATQQRKP